MSEEKKLETNMECEVIHSETGEVLESEYVLNLKSPITFEGKRYEKIDLYPLEELSAEDLIQVERLYDKKGGASFLKELTIEFSILLASRGTKLPIELFRQLKMKDAEKLKNRVTGFLYGQESD